MEIKTIQDLINQKAENKLKADLKNLNDSLSHNFLLSWAPPSETGKPFPRIYHENQEGKMEDVSLSHAFTGTMYKNLYEYWLPVYEKRESEAFMLAVENIQGQVYNLMNPNSLADDY